MAAAAAAGRAVQASASSSGRRVGGGIHSTPSHTYGSAPAPARQQQQQQQARRGAATVAAAKTPRRRGGADVASVWSALMGTGHSQAAGSGAGGAVAGHEDTTPVVAAAAPGQVEMNSAPTMAPRRKRGPKAATASTRFFGDDPTEHVEQYVDAAQAADTRALNREQLLRALSLLETKEREVHAQSQELFGLLRTVTQLTQIGDEMGPAAAALSRTASFVPPPPSSVPMPSTTETTLSHLEVEEEACTVQHPGALCCTKWKLAQSPGGGAVTVKMETTCEQQGDITTHELDMEDYVALALRALADRAMELSSSAANAVRGVDSTNDAVHQELLDVLYHGEVVTAQPNEVVSKFGHPSYMVRLRHPQTAVEIDAIFKPRVEGDGDGWHRANIEWVAYELNRMLGMDYVPPVAYRTGGVDVDFKHYEEGAFILFVNNVKELREAPSGTRGVPLERVLTDTRILDVLLHNSDRHHGHFLHGEHWAIKESYDTPMMRPVLIDHAAGFRPEAFVSMEHENAFCTGPVKKVAARTYLRLRFLDAKRVACKFSGVLSEQEMRGLLHRRNEVLTYLDNLVDANGYDQTVFDHES